MPRPTGLARTDGGLSSISPGTGSYIDVADEAALGLVDNTALPTGEVAWVRTYLDWWVLKQSGAALVPNEIINALVIGAGWRWHRANEPNGYWQSQTDLYVNSATGNDENAGGAGTPLKTYDEVNRRVAGKPTDSGVGQTVHFLADYASPLFVYNSNDPLNGPFTTIDFAETILLDNIAVTSTTATNSAATPPVQTTISSATIPASWTASGLVGATLIGKTGVITDYAFTVMQDLGGGGHQARITLPGDINGLTLEPVAGNTCKAVIYAQATGGVIVSDGVYFTKARITGGNFRFLGEGPVLWACKGTPTAATVDAYGASFIACNMSINGGASPLNVNGYLSDAASWWANGLIVSQLEGVGTYAPSAAQYGAGVVVASGGHVAVTHSNPNTQAGMGFFAAGALTNPITVNDGGVVDMTNARAYGSGLTGTGITLRQSALLLGTANDPNLNGVTDEIDIDGAKMSMATVRISGSVAGMSGSVASVSGAATGGINMASISMSSALRTMAVRQ